MGVDRKAQIQTISSEKFWEFPFKLVWHELCLRLQAPIKCSDVSHCKRYKNFLETYFEANVWGDFISHHHHGKLWVLPTSDQAINIYLWTIDNTILIILSSFWSGGLIEATKPTSSVELDFTKWVHHSLGTELRSHPLTFSLPYAQYDGWDVYYYYKPSPKVSPKTVIRYWGGF